MNRYIIFIPIIIGAIMIICGLLIRNRPKGKVKNGIFTEALIIDFAVKTAYVKKVPYKAVSPIVEFQTQNGSVKAVYPFFVNQDYVKFKRGDTIKICYDKNNTNNFHIEDDGSKNDLGFVLMISGAFMIIADIVMFLQY